MLLSQITKTKVLQPKTREANQTYCAYVVVLVNVGNEIQL